MREVGLEKTKRVNHHSAKSQGFFRDIDGFTQVEKNKIVEWWPYAMTYYTNLLRKFPTTPDDVLFDGVEDALIYAVRTYQPDKGSSFKSWFHRACSMAVYRSYLRYKNGYLVNYSRDSRINRHDSNEDAVRDTDCWSVLTPYGCTQWEDQCVDRLAVDEVMSCLNPQEKDIMRRVYVYNEKQADIARAMGVTRQRVSFVHSEAIRKCREAAKEG